MPRGVSKASPAVRAVGPWIGRRSLGTITEKMLSQQLRELESLGFIKRHVYREVPPKVEYSLTDFGRSIGPILDKFAEWGVANLRKVKALSKAA